MRIVFFNGEYGCLYLIKCINGDIVGTVTLSLVL